MTTETAAYSTRVSRLVIRMPRMLTEDDDYSWVPLGDVLVAITDPELSETAYPEGTKPPRMDALIKAGEVRLAALEVWDSIPASYDPDDPMVKRHAAALNDLGRVLRGEPVPA